MADAGEGLIDAEDDYQEKLAERERLQERKGQGPPPDPTKARERKSLDLARAELHRQAESTSHPVRRAQIETALAELDRRIAGL
jgi:hypothetical protein